MNALPSKRVLLTHLAAPNDVGFIWDSPCSSFKVSLTLPVRIRGKCGQFQTYQRRFHKKFNSDTLAKTQSMIVEKSRKTNNSRPNVLIFVGCNKPCLKHCHKMSIIFPKFSSISELCCKCLLLKSFHTSNQHRLTFFPSNI